VASLLVVVVVAGLTQITAFIILPPLPPITVVFGCGGGRFASNSGAGSDGNDSRWRCATPDLSSASCMPFRLMGLWVGWLVGRWVGV